METGLDYFGARYYSSNLGRWMSADWAAKPTTVPYAQFNDPQSLNLYAYVKNNPIGIADPDGHTGGNGDATDPGLEWAKASIMKNEMEEAEQQQQEQNQGQSQANQQIVDTVNSALQQPDLSKCLNTWIGPGLVLTNSNLPYLDATKSGAQLAQIINSKKPTIEGTVKEPVPSAGRPTVYVASEVMGNKKEAMRVYVHEMGNALAMQRFSGGARDGAYRGARGGPPGIDQSSGNNILRDKDIGYQLEQCVFGAARPWKNETITVTPN